MPEQPLVTIVTPSFNQGAFIGQTIEGVLAQDYPHIEYLVIDGGSTDETLDVLRRYKDRISWVSEPDNGQCAAINKGFRRATGEIIAWLNSDDVFLPRAISESVAFFQANPEMDLVYGDIQYIDAAGKVLVECARSKPFSLPMLLTQFATIQQPSAFFRKRVFDHVGFLNEQLHFFLDTEFWMRIALHSRGAYLPGLRAQARLHDTSKTMSQQERFWAERRQVLDSLFTLYSLPAEAHAAKIEAYAHCELYWGESLLQLKAQAEARPHLRIALATHPRWRRRTLALFLLIDSYLGTRLASIGRRLRDRFERVSGNKENDGETTSIE